MGGMPWPVFIRGFVTDPCMLNPVREGEEDHIEVSRYRRRLKIFENFLFYLAASFPNKAFVFPNNGISKVCISCQGWFRKTCTFACVISLKRKTNSRK